MIQQNKGDIHLFTTNHPWFLEIGLSSFTTGTLIDWWNQKTADGRYLNRRHINKPITSSDPLPTTANGLDKLLGISTDTEFFWEGWKPNADIQNAGRFKKQNLKGASGNTGGSDADKWKYKNADISNALKMNELAKLGVLYAMSPSGEAQIPFYNSITPFDSNNPSTLLQGIKPLYGLIQLNKWMVLFQNYFPRKLWGQSQDPLIPDWALVTEIKASKAGSSLQWSGPVKFYVDNGVFGQCEIEENVFFNLYLGNESMMKSGNNAVTIKNLTIVGPKVNAFGTTSLTDGDSTSPSVTDPASQTAGTLDTVWNPITRKLQSGNRNVLAKLTTDLEPSLNSPALSHLMTAVISEDLDDEKNTYSFIPSSGSAMPISSQNSMPLQWSVNYAHTKEARCSDSILEQDRNKKLSVPVFNFNPIRSYPSGEIVLLTQIDSLWIVSSLGEKNDTLAAQPTGGSIGKWGAFTYMATSSEFFFKAKKVSDGATVNVTPRSAELNFHKLYYKYSNADDYRLNYGISGVDYGLAGGYNSGVPFDTLTHETWIDEPGWFQTTSFDYLDSQIFGIRDKVGIDGKRNGNKCSISSTSATINAAGNPIPINENPSSRNSAHTGTFFGCVFPAGYDGTNVYDQADEVRSWKVRSAAGGTSDPNKYFTIIDINKNPFDYNIADSRNNSNAKCNATNAGNVFNPPADGNKWARGSDNADASLFYLGLNDGRKTIPADVMLNASPYGKNGSPIKPIGLFNEINKNTAKTPQDIINLVTGGVWLNKAPIETTSPANPYDSAFDFPPMKSDNLMFRPLKLEGYLQFGLPEIARYKYGTERDVALVPTLVNVQQSIGGFYAEAARTQVDKTFPISYYAPMREQSNCSSNRIGEAAGGALKWGGWVKVSDDAGVPIKTKYGKRLHKAGYWNTSNGGGMNWTTKPDMADAYKTISDWDGAAAFGVITTSNKVKANNKIEFTTSNFYGMSAAGGTPPTINSFTQLTNSSSQDQEKTWGVGNFTDSYKQEHIIDLSVRIYQGHDSSSTVYDPRYFAVHHFNPGVESIVNDTRLSLQENFGTLRDSNGSVLSIVKYNYQQASGVDVKVPSRYQKFTTETSGVQPDPTLFHENNKEYIPVQLPTGAFVFSDLTFTGNEVSPKIMPQKNWDVDKRRTGKLLPYKYEVLTLTIPANIKDEMPIIFKAGNGDLTVFEVKDKLIVTNRGINYQLGDIVGILELNIFLKVKKITAGGLIETLEVLDNGENLTLAFCMETSKTIKESNPDPKYKVTTLLRTGGSLGKDFEAYFVCAQVRAKAKCDPKPFLIKDTSRNEIVRIAANFAGPTHSTQDTSVRAEAESYINKPGGATFDLSVGNVKSADSTYDIFFHFHNDITMTWLACGNFSTGQPHGDTFNPTESEEQHVTIESIKLT